MLNRRNFLKSGIALGATAAMLGQANAEEAAAENAGNVAQPDTYTVSMRSLSPTQQPRVITVPDVEGFKVLKGDFHMHTLFSDGHVMPRDRVLEAVNNGFDVISITDHFEYRPYFSEKGRWKLNAGQAADCNLWYDVAKPEADKRGLLLVRGAEVTKSTLPPGHFNVLFTTDNNPIMAEVADWRKMLSVAADQGAFLLWNHPGWAAPNSGGLPQKAPLRFFPEHEEAWKNGWMHGIEVFNGKECYPVVPDWCNERDLAVIANSDIHDSELNTYGYQNPQRPMTLVLAKERTVESVKEAFFARRTVACAGGLVWGRDPWLPALFRACVTIKPALAGTLELTNISSLPITVKADGFTIELPTGIPKQIHRMSGWKTLTVTNWMVGMNKPLEAEV